MRQQLFIFTFLLFYFESTFAQHVTRKGMTPITKGNAASSPAVLYTIGQLNGKWQEVKRVAGKNEQSFTDTLLLSVKNGKGFIRNDVSMNMQMQGPAAIEAPATLEIAGDAYTIKKLVGDLLMLEDDDAMHTMKKVPAFRFEGEGKDSIVWAKNEMMNSVNLKDLAGKWMVYRKQAAPGFIDDQTVLIKTISFLSYNGDGSAAGEIVTYDKNNISETSPCTFNFSDGKLNIVYKGTTSSVNVYKATPTEFIFGDEKGVLNYAKH